ncbi:hypothetical protein R1flu_015096 [Riccia fluitans]|uniref:Uncharacterized protein n=1 Tax=Riccia fluitans TaxID=41844 RepID=A0ABD1YIB3_9MARC
MGMEKCGSVSPKGNKEFVDEDGFQPVRSKQLKKELGVQVESRTVEKARPSLGNNLVIWNLFYELRRVTSNEDGTGEKELDRAVRKEMGEN